jgi:hypothetical protein
VLLKALEEPGARQMFVLVADEPSRLLPTIRSRAQPMRIGPVARDELAAWLVDRERLPADQAAVLARVSNGLAGTAVAYARTPELIAWRRRVQAELLGLLGRGLGDRFAAVPELIDAATKLGGPPLAAQDEGPADEEGGGQVRVAASVQRSGAMRVVDAWLQLTRDLMVASAGDAVLAPAGELLPELAATARRIPVTELAAFARTLDRVHDGLEQNASPRLALEAAMLDWPSVESRPA